MCAGGESFGQDCLCGQVHHELRLKCALLRDDDDCLKPRATVTAECHLTKKSQVTLSRTTHHLPLL